MTSIPQSATTAPGRRYDIDWLRVLATLIVLLFHSARYFDNMGWHVKNPERSTELMVLVVFLAQWMMPLFFVLSAMSSVFVLRRRSVARYLFDRVLRLLVPFTLGTFVVLIPLQVWIERVTNGDFDGSFWAFYPHYFDGWYAFGGNFAWMGLHLWYLQFLFLFSLLTVPVFRVLLKASSLTERLAGLCQKNGGIFLLSLPVVAVELWVNLDPDGIGMRDFGGWSLLSYVAFFIVGFVLATHDGYRLACQRHRVAALVVGIVLMVFELHPFWAEGSFFSDYIWRIIARALNAWLWLVAILGFASRHLSRPHAFLSYANEGVLPFYVLHQTVIVFLGFLALDWAIAIPIKFFLLVLTSFIIILATYHFAIRPLGAVRWLFGMKSTRPTGSR
jgi:glucans biosynthesis protein C